MSSVFLKQTERELILAGESAAAFVDSVNQALNADEALMDAFCAATLIPEAKEIVGLAEELYALQEFRDAVQWNEGGLQAAFEIDPAMALNSIHRAELYAKICDRIMTPFVLASHMPQKAKSSRADTGCFVINGAGKLAEICSLRIDG